MKKTVKFIAASLVFVLASSIAGMDLEEKIVTPHEVVFDLLIPYLDADSLVSCAVLSHESNKKILALINERKEKLLKKPNNSIEALHHKYRASRCFVHRPAHKGLQLVLQEFNNGQYHNIQSLMFNDFSCLSIKPCLFFNKEGILSFYSFGGIYLKSDNYLPHKPYMEGIIRYDLQGKSLRCVLSTQHTQGLVSRLDMFLSYPYLLNAILNSMDIKNETATKGTIEFMLEGVTLPSNYDEFKMGDRDDNSAGIPGLYFSYKPQKILYSTFNDIPDAIRKPIEDHYAFQQNKKIKDIQNKEV